MPADGKVQERLEVPDPVTLPGVRVQTLVSLLARLTAPVNPFKAPIVIVEVAAVFALVVTEVGVALIEKSGAAVKVTVTLCESEPLVPVTVT